MTDSDEQTLFLKEENKKNKICIVDIRYAPFRLIHSWIKCPLSFTKQLKNSLQIFCKTLVVLINLFIMTNCLIFKFPQNIV